MNGLERIIENYLANKTEEELREVLKDLDGAMFKALEEDKKRCEKFMKLAKNKDFLNESSSRVYKKIKAL